MIRPTVAAFALSAGALSAQQTAESVLRVRVTSESAPVASAIVRTGSTAQITDASGTATLRVAPGAIVLTISRLGFRPDTARFVLSPGADTTVVIQLVAAVFRAEAVVVGATRAERRVEDTPIRVEIVDEDEILEKGAMTPGDITMLLNETPGLRVQTTSPSLGGAGVRIQGLRGRYTLLLADGLPLYGGQSGGLGLLQIPPVDLARAEIIKGTASALYGPSALGGVINLISRRPGDGPETELLLNQTSRSGTDAILFAARPFTREGWGGTLLASAHRQDRTDIDRDGWADMPKYERIVLRPRLFFDDRVGRSLFATAGLTVEDRSGGTMPASLAPDGSPFAEGLGTVRLDAGASARRVSARGDMLALRASVSDQRHRHRIGTVLERDEHRTAFGELSATLPRGATTWVLGTSFELNDYTNRAAPGFGYTHSAPSVFAQADHDVSRWLILSANARVDSHNEYGTTFSPRLSVLLRAPDGRFADWNARVSAGGGTFAPNPLTEDTEVTGLTPLRPLDSLSPERAFGTSVDISGLISLGDDARIDLNFSAFASEVTDAVEAVDDVGTTAAGARFMRLLNAPFASRTAGGEVLARLVVGDARITASYGYTDATEWDAESASSVGRVDSPVIPRHTAGLVATMEREDEGRAGLELYYVGRQQLDDDPYRTESRAHFVIGLLVEKVMGRARVFLNAENLLDERQTRYDPLVLPTRGSGGRWTTDVWSLLEGRTVNGGVRLSF
ncbi:MAG: TonB-dependent receptor [Gemmatimonadetes bacterium]|nr:TonB-dependent receptor [Gemmatimonadota bacterium]